MNEGSGVRAVEVRPSGTVSFVVVTGASADDAAAHLAHAATNFEGAATPLSDTPGAMVLVFDRASAAIAAAVTLSKELDAGQVKVRVAVHVGEATPDADGRYSGAALTAAIELAGRAVPGRVLVSAAVAALAGHDPGEVDVDRARVPLGHRGDLPSSLTKMFGRQGALEELRGRVGRDRLITLTGSGGVGKTRLAIAVASTFVDEMPGGVWFVDFSAIGAAGGCGRALLNALGVTEVRDVATSALVGSELNGRGRSLVILDNCEHVLDEAAELVAGVLQECTATSVLVTSREPLELSGEVVWRVPSLTCAPLDDLDGTVDASGYDAIALFIDRARRARPSFVVSGSDVALIGKVCARLDGIPLAIELAAARCRHLDLAGIVAGLDHRFSLLVGSSRAAVPRQRTLQASVMWSFDIADHDEQVVLRRLGVFAGAFSLDAAEAVVASIGDIAGVGVFELICRLVDKSLVTIENANGSTRYRLLETIREFAAQRADEAGELTALRDSHAAWWLERIDSLGTGPTDAVIALTDANHHDLVASLTWTATRDEILALQLLRPLARAFQGTGRAGDAMPVITQLLNPDVEQRHPLLWAQAAVAAAIPVLSFCGIDAYIDLLSRSEQRSIELDHPFLLAASRWLLSMTLETSRAFLEQSLAEGLDYAAALAAVRLVMDTARQDPDNAEQALADANRMAADYGSQYIRDFNLVATGSREVIFGDVAAILDAGRRLATNPTAAMQTNRRGLLTIGGLLARDPSAITEAADSARRAADRGEPHGPADLANALAALALLDGTEPVGLPANAEWAPLLVARSLIGCGDADRAARVLADARPGPTTDAERHALDGALTHDEDEWHLALELADRHGLRLVAVDAIEALGVLAAEADGFAEALRLIGAAHRLRDETGYRWRFHHEQVRIDIALERARVGVGQQAEAIWHEGAALEWHDAVAFARRSRGQRQRPRHGWASLTPTELRVAELAADGLSNPEIANRLLMGRGTVKSHLEHIYAKTGHRNRVELTAAHHRNNSRP